MDDITVSPQCFAAGGTNWGDSQCKRGRIKTQGSATDSTRYHVCLTQNHWRQWGRFHSTGYTVVYLLCKHSGLYIWHAANVRGAWRDVSSACSFFSAEEAIWHIQWSTITNPVSHGRVSQKEAIHLQHSSQSNVQKYWHYHVSFLDVLDSVP